MTYPSLKPHLEKAIVKRLFTLASRAHELGIGVAAIAALNELVKDAEDLQRAAKGSSRRARAPRRAKAKGREGVVMAKRWIQRWYPALADDDILIQTTSVGGSDLHYSPLAKEFFPFAPEIKNVEQLNVWLATKQAEINAKKRGLEPVLFFRRNNTAMWVAFPCRSLYRLRAVAYDAAGELDGQAPGRRTEDDRQEDTGGSGV